MLVSDWLELVSDRNYIVLVKSNSFCYHLYVCMIYVWNAHLSSPSYPLNETLSAFAQDKQASKNYLETHFHAC